MKHPIYRPIAIGALLALASLITRTSDPKDIAIRIETGGIVKVSQTSPASVAAPL